MRLMYLKLRATALCCCFAWLLVGCAASTKPTHRATTTEGETNSEQGTGTADQQSAATEAPNTKARARKERLQPSETALYRGARKSLNSHSYKAAIDQFQQLESLYPFGRYAEQAQLEIIYAYYKNHDFSETRSAVDRFVQLHPDDANADYAQYLKGLAAFSQGQKPFEMAFSKTLSGRDLGSMRDSFSDFQELLEQFPDSEYTADARQRMVFIRNLLAAREVEIGRYYLDRKAFLAAANRANHVVEYFSQTPAVEDALTLLISAYSFMNLDDLSKEVLLVLQRNYPDNPNFTKNGDYAILQHPKAKPRSWLNIVSFGLLARPRVPKPLILQPNG